MYFWISAATVAGCIYLTPKKSAMRIVLWAWAAAIVLPALPLVTWQVEYSLLTDAFVAGCLLVMTLAYRHARRPAEEPPPPRYAAAGKERQIAWGLAALGAIGCVLILIDSGVPISLRFLIENLATIRTAAFDRAANSASISRIALLAGFLAPSSVLVIIAAVHLKDRWLRVAALGSFVLLAMTGLLVYGGRTVLVMAVLIGAVSWRLGGGRISLGPRTWVGVALAILVVSYFSVSWVNARQGPGFRAEAALGTVQRAELKPWVGHNPTVATAVLSFGYFSSPLPALTFYVDHGPLPGPMYGGYSFPLPAQALAKAEGAPTAVRADQRLDVFAPFESNGYFGNVWPTIIRDLLVDFRWPGVLLCFAIFGWFLAWARNRFERTAALHYHYLETIACYTVAFGAFTSYLPEGNLSVAFGTALAVMLVTRVELGRQGVVRRAYVTSRGPSSRA